jgi:hypothetical protein
MLNILETRVPITLGGVKRTMVFNANTFAAYEESTGKFFLDTAASLFDAMKPFLEARKSRALQTADADNTSNASIIDVLRKVSIKDLRALLWASLHEYDEAGDPVWPLTLNEVGRVLKTTDIPAIFTAFLRGQSENSPTPDEVGESQASPATKPRPVNGAPPKEADGGGERSIELPQAAFDFANKT